MDNKEVPLILCMENTLGDDVTLKVDPKDDFQSFLEKAKSLLGFDVDINSITKNQIVDLKDNVYDFLIKAESNNNDSTNIKQKIDKLIEDTTNETMYVLDDGTQINASQIQFDNDDPLIDLSAEKIPFVKYNDEINDETDIENKDLEETRNYNITDSPVSCWSSTNSSPKKSFVNSLPFKLVCNDTAGYEYKMKYNDSNTSKTYATLNNVTIFDKSPRSLIKENFRNFRSSSSGNKNTDEFTTREEILNMFKDSPVASMSYHNSYLNEKRRHVRKSDPLRPVPKNFNEKPLSYIDFDGTLISQSACQNCFICDKVEKKSEKLYLFDYEDQKLHRSSPQRKSFTQLKIICDICLAQNFRPSCVKSSNQSLRPDEYLVIKNNQQFIFQKINDFVTKKSQLSNNGEATILKDHQEPNGDNATGDDSCVVKKESEESDFDIDNIINNLEEADENVKEFLGKNQSLDIKELKCRFCAIQFFDVSEALNHCGAHKHDLEDGSVFPCPFCDYGYSNIKWIQCHLKAVHDNIQVKNEEIINRKPDNLDGANPDNSDSEHKTENVNLMEVKMEVKRECPSSDDELWIVHTGDQDASDISQLLKKDELDDDDFTHNCHICSQLFTSEANLSSHKCRRRGRKRKPNKDDITMQVHSDEEVLKRPIKKKNEPSSDPQIVTCHNCNESFTSKVRLKFHMQFHENSSMLTSDGKYRCGECPNAEFRREWELFDHVHFQHHKHRRWQCPAPGCRKTFCLRATLTKHSRTHTDTRRYACETCGKRFLDKQTLDEHTVTHLQIKPFQCHICMKQLTRRSRLRMHLRAHEEALPAKALPVCTACGRAFGNLEAAVAHANSSQQCMEFVAKDIKREPEEPTVQLSPTSGIVRHTIEVTESLRLPYTAPSPPLESEASEMFEKLQEEVRSLIAPVMLDKVFRCEYCENVYYLEEALNSHRAIHKGVKNPFTCHICKVSFATYSRCTTHKTTHGFYKRPLADAKRDADDTEKPKGPVSKGILGYGGFPVAKHFLCEDCGRSYLHWTYLQVHRRMKHANENFIYKCNTCKQIFPNSWSVAYHRKKAHGKNGPDDGTGTTKIPREKEINHRIPCRDCNELLANKTALYKHRKLKHSDKGCQMSDTQDIYCCDVCGQQFTSSQNLEAHALLHVHKDQNTAKSAIRSFRMKRKPRQDVTANFNNLMNKIIVIEVKGLNPSPEYVTEQLTKNNISGDKVSDITKISFTKGYSSIIPSSVEALCQMRNLPESQVYFVKPPPAKQEVQINQLPMTNHSTYSRYHRPAILQRGGGGDSSALSYQQELPDLSMQLFLPNGVLVNGNQMVQLELNDTNLLGVE